MSIADQLKQGDIAALVGELRSRDPLPMPEVIRLMDQWGSKMERDRTLMSVPGAPFLTMWLRRAHLETLVGRELGQHSLNDDWQIEGKVRFRHLPVGVVAHWPATNVEVQPLLSAFCGVLSKNASVVRVSPSLRAIVEPLVNSLYQDETLRPLADRIAFISFRSDDLALNQEMARSCDGAMIWGGEDAIKSVRALDFPPWARINCYGPRVSAALVHGSAYGNPTVNQTNLEKLCNRIAREVWQFEQNACSSPQVLFVEKTDSISQDRLRQGIVAALERENRYHPRQELTPFAASKIVQARANWTLQHANNRATFPATPDWTLLESEDAYAFPTVEGYRVLHLSWVDSLDLCLSGFDGHIQTLGMAINDPEMERSLGELAVTRGVDRVVPIGKMHVFDSPWDGMPLLAGLTRIVRQSFCQNRGQS